MSNDAMQNDLVWMKRALELARKAESIGEVPVGALLVIDDKIVASGINRRETWTTPLGHAELISLQRASQKLGSWRLLNSTLYVTLEPCVMCAGALVQARVSRVVFGAYDPKGGGVSSLYQIGKDDRLNHRFEIHGGILEEECSQLLKSFFKKKREKTL